MTAMMYPNVQGQDELATLFSQNLTLEPRREPAPAPAPVQVPVQVPAQEEKIVYISQHYTHSAHIARHDVHVPQQQHLLQLLPPRSVSEPPPQLENSAVETVLRKYGVSTSGLSSAQLQLFKTVDDPQRLKLIELWRACPPTNSNDNPTLLWSMTTVDQEEILAKMRYEQKQRATEQQTTAIMSLDGTPLTPIQGGDGRWLAATSHSYMEPYMASGYEDMARREYEESARRALVAEAMMEQQPKDVFSSQFGPGQAPVSVTAGPTFNPRHADPVYNTGAAVDWRQEELRQQEAMRQQEHMANQYGRLVSGFRQDADEEML
ncbi:hypothetical protein B0H63DRAFT_458281 [Podospora didyma]|uniref:Uncharacterized protein n=1 Tax=Podospora didyma TaxID=330526 RepID=A0AAE0P532_9PEZI|nr:hypothetical protein B0H63DRAFT_458281 [Podospora didyma]